MGRNGAKTIHNIDSMGGKPKPAQADDPNAKAPAAAAPLTNQPERSPTSENPIPPSDLSPDDSVCVSRSSEPRVAPADSLAQAAVTEEEYAKRQQGLIEAIAAMEAAEARQKLADQNLEAAKEQTSH